MSTVIGEVTGCVIYEFYECYQEVRSPTYMLFAYVSVCIQSAMLWIHRFNDEFTYTFIIMCLLTLFTLTGYITQ